MRVWLLDVFAKTAEDLEVLELRLEDKSDERSAGCWRLSFQVVPQALYKQVGTLLPNVRAFHTPHLRAVWAAMLPRRRVGGFEGRSQAAGCLDATS